MFRNKVSAPFAASLLAFGWMFFFFHAVFLHPNDHLFNEQGDGIKAFYVFADHIKNDESYHQQRNMNYPYGQTFVFTDGQPAIANALKYASSILPFFQTHCIAIYNYLIICSFIICAWFLALILQRMKLPPLFIILGAFCITALSPQIWRISGHPTMSYAFFFPLSWYLLLKVIHSGYQLRFILFSILNTTFWFFVHPYLGMVIIFFYGLYFTVMPLTKKWKSIFSAQTIISVLLLILVPLVIFKWYTLSVDHHLMRSEFPWGFWVFHTDPAPMFLPHSGIFAPIFDYIFHFDSAKWEMERIYYIGLAADLLLLITFLRIVRFIFKKKAFRLMTPILSSELSISFLAASLLLLFAMCIPFRFRLQFLVEHFGFLRQFRAPGRFAWAFYYVSTVFGVYSFFLIFRFLKIKKNNLPANGLVVLFFSLFILEAYPDVREKSKWAVMPKNLFNQHLLPPAYSSMISKVDSIKDNYQCLVTLPFFHVGTENFGVEFTDDNIRTSCVVSYWCNIPLMASSAARSPIEEGKNIMQFFSPGYIKKAIEKDLPSKKDFLIVYNKEQLNDREMSMLEKSTKLFDNGKYELWSLTYENAFRDNTDELVNHCDEIRDSLEQQGAFKVSGQPDIIAYNSFDTMKSDFVYKGNGALQVKKKDFTILYKSRGKLKPNINYTASFWYYNKGELRNQVTCIVDECDKNGKNCKWEITWSPITSMVIDGDWSLVEKKFMIKEGNSRIKIFVQGDLKSNQDIFIDEFLLRTSLSDIFSEMKSGKSSYLFYNNRWLMK